MTHLWDVYHELHNGGVFFFEQQLPFSNESVAAVTVECNDTYGIFVDTSKFSAFAEEAVAVAHEAGHCMTGSTHRLNSSFDLIQRHETRADKWAIKKLIPKDELDEAVAAGYTQPWELAEYFDVTEEFIKKAICWYTHGNLAADLYF